LGFEFMIIFYLPLLELSWFHVSGHKFEKLTRVESNQSNILQS